VLAVDFDPDVVAACREEGIAAIYGDASDPALLDQLPGDAMAIVIALPPIVAGTLDVDPRTILTRELRARGVHAPIAVTVGGRHDEAKLVELGATLTFRPLGDAADLASTRLLEVLAGVGPAPTS
jgi:hypothetical protein